MAKEYVISVATAGDKAIAGPVVAAALVFDAHMPAPRFVWSSSRGRPLPLSDFDGLPSTRKSQISAWLRDRCGGFSLVTNTVRQLNTWDFRDLRRVSMGRAVYRAAEHALFRDSGFKPAISNTKLYVSGMDTLDPRYVGSADQTTFPERLGRPWQLDAAYAIARSYRDGLMREAHKLHPDYEFALNNGYASVSHRVALEQKGPTPLHREAAPLVREVTTAHDDRPTSPPR